MLIVFAECIICISLFVYKMKSKNTIKDGYINYTNHKYYLSKASIDEIQSKMKLNILYEGKDNKLSHKVYALYPSKDTEELISKFMRNISDVYIDYMDNGNEDDYISATSVLGLDRNFEGTFEFKMNRIIQSLCCSYIQETDFYINGYENIGTMDGIDFIQLLGYLTVNTGGSNTKEIRCYRRNIDNNYIEIKVNKAFGDYF